MIFTKLNKSINRINLSLYTNRNVRHKIRQFVSTMNVCSMNTVKTHTPDWKKTTREAEKIVGYPLSLLSSKWLLESEVLNATVHLTKLMRSNHPLLTTITNMLNNGRNSIQLWGLIILLISKATSQSPNTPNFNQGQHEGILHSQRSLAEITELIRMSYFIHKSIQNTGPSMQDKNNMLFGNKIALLTGDYLLSTAGKMLAELKNQELMELINSALRDQSESEFVGPRDQNNNPLPAQPIPFKKEIDPIGNTTMQPLNVDDVLGHARLEWTTRHVLNGASLLGKSCQGTLKIGGHSPLLQEQGYIFGKHLALLWQMSSEIETFQVEYIKPFSLISAPVMFHLEYDPSLYSQIQKGMEDIFDVDYKLIHKEVLSGPGVKKAMLFKNELTQTALNVLQNFSKSGARTALTNIVKAL